VCENSREETTTNVHLNLTDSLRNLSGRAERIFILTTSGQLVKTSGSIADSAL